MFIVIPSCVKDNKDGKLMHPLPKHKLNKLYKHDFLIAYRIFSEQLRLYLKDKSCPFLCDGNPLYCQVLNEFNNIDPSR